MQASLKARRSFLGSSTANWSACVSWSSSGRWRGLLGLAFSFSGVSMEAELGVGMREGALIRRVVSQVKGSGLASETATVTMSPVMMAARFPAKVGYSIPVVVTLKVP